MGGPAVSAAKSQTFLTGGRPEKIPARCLRAAPERPSLPPLLRKLLRRTPVVFVHFPRRLAAMAAVAQALQIAPVAESCPVSLVVHDVVHVRCPDTKPTLCALAAEGFAQELRRSKIAFPPVGLVHPAPRLCLSAAPVAAWPVCVAVTIAHQHAAAGMPAGSEWLLAHGLSPPGKNKKPAPTQTASADHVAQALRHRHSSIFTMDSFPQILQYTVNDRALVSGLSRRTFPRPHRGQRSHPFFVSSLAVFSLFCNAFSSLS